MAARSESARAVSVLMVSLVGLLVTTRQVMGIAWPVAPQNSAHAINKTYGDWNGDRFYIDSLGCHIRYHTGVDIPADSGDAVLAVLNGYVRYVKRYADPDSAYLGYICVARTLGGSPWWHYGHVTPHDSMLQVGRPISNTDTLGFVAPFRPDLSNCHLHFYLEEEVGNLTRSVCNPLDSLAPAPSHSS